jgi:hypothetical protein
MFRALQAATCRAALALALAVLVSVSAHRTASAQPAKSFSQPVEVIVVNSSELEPGDSFRDPEQIPGVQNLAFPRVFAMGDAGVALRTPAAIRLNPAAIGQEGSVVTGANLGTEHLIASEAPLFGEWITTASVSIQTKRRWAIGAQFTQQSNGTVELRDDMGNRTGELNSFDRKFSISGAYRLSDAWSVGAGLGYLQESFGTTSGGSPALDLGVHGGWTLEAGSVSLEPSVGWSLVNLGPTFNLGESTRPLPMTMRLGGATRLASDRTWMERPVVALTVQAELSKVLVGGEYESNPRDPRVGSVVGQPYGPWEALTKTWGRAYAAGTSEERLSAWQQVGRHVGAEATVYGIASLRIGRRGGNETYTNRRYTTFGVGLDLVYVRLDYARVLGDPISESSTSAFVADYGGTSYFRVTVPFPLNGEHDGNWW